MDVTASMQSRWVDVDLPPPVASTQYEADTHGAIRANYAAMIENIDSHLGSYLDYLASRGCLERTVVIYASDHGEMLGDHDRWGKVVPHQPSVHVPLVLAGPGIEAKPHCDAWVDLVDVAATVLHLAGADFPGSKGQVLTAGPLASRKVVGLGGWRAIYEDGMKYVHNFDPEAARGWLDNDFDPAEAHAALFDLHNDPHERENLVVDQPRTASRLRQVLLEIVEENHG